MSQKKGFWDDYKSTLKSEDTEETFDLMFYRPIGYIWARLAAKVGITPNAITIASIFLGVGAGVLFYYNNLWLNILGVILLVWADSFDSADGQLARMTKQYSRIGRILDGLSGDFWFAAIYIAICLRENVTSEFFSAHHWVIWVMAVVTGICHGTQAAMADYYRQFHLFFVKGKDGSELDTAQEEWDKFHALSWKRNFWKKLTQMFYANYTSGQEKRTPRMQELRKALKEKYGDNIPPEFREKFRALSKPLMKYTNILSFNTRTFALFAAILIFRMPWLYFAFELVVLNILLVYMI
ncbi:MAG: CDP-alcohol phosphatidyltransferase family protein, partial [Muribaculaceae bacterium]|nr:CDP-alcohol phosphatidyltransferase family protein [Muribaculaceae bacterium]